MDQLLSSAAFKFNLRRFNVVVSCPDDAGRRAFGLNVTLWEWQIADGIKVVDASIQINATKVGPSIHPMLLVLATSQDAIQFKKRGSECVWMTWWAMCLADIARHVTGCHLNKKTRFKVRLDDVAGNIGPTIHPGARHGRAVQVDSIKARVESAYGFST
jgi:hypothetical protein